MTSILKVIRGFFAIVAPIVILLIHFIVMMSFINRWDEVVTITLIPIWMWAIAGMCLSLIAWAAFGSRLSLLTFFIWLLTGIACADETPGLLREFRSAVARERPDTSETASENQRFRVVSFRCGEDHANLAREIQPLKPDVILLQDAPDESALRSIAEQLFEGKHAVIVSDECAIVAKGEMEQVFLDPDSSSIIASLDLRNGVELDLVNLKLQPAVLRYDIYDPDTWRYLTRLRVENRTKLRELLRKLPERVIEKPTIIGGDFGTPPGDDIFRSLMPEYEDAFRESGEGWGNTWPGKGAIVRIDQIWANEFLNPEKSFTVSSASSQHRFVVADYEIVKPSGTLAMNTSVSP